MATGTGRRRARLGAPRLFPGSPRRRRAIRPAAPAAPFPKEPRSRRRWIAAPARRRCYGRSARSGARSRSPPPCCSSAVSAVWCSACRSGPALRHRRSNLRNGPSRRFQLSPRRRAHRPPRRPPIPVREGCPRRRSLGRDRMRGLRQQCQQCPVRALARASGRRRRSAAEDRGGGTGAARIGGTAKIGGRSAACPNQEQAAQREQASQREILARREAALASLPSVTAPLPSPSPRAPRAESRPPFPADNSGWCCITALVPMPRRRPLAPWRRRCAKPASTSVRPAP